MDVITLESNGKQAYTIEDTVDAILNAKKIVVVAGTRDPLLPV